MKGRSLSSIRRLEGNDLATDRPQKTYTCLVCGKLFEEIYGRWADGGTCRKACEQIQEAKPRYPQSAQLSAQQQNRAGAD